MHLGPIPEKICGNFGKLKAPLNIVCLIFPLISAITKWTKQLILAVSRSEDGELFLLPQDSYALMKCVSMSRDRRVLFRTGLLFKIYWEDILTYFDIWSLTIAYHVKYLAVIESMKGYTLYLWYSQKKAPPHFPDYNGTSLNNVTREKCSFPPRHM